MSFEKFSYVRIPPILQLIYTNLAQNYRICLGLQAWIRIPFKIVLFIETEKDANQSKHRCILFKKMRF